MSLPTTVINTNGQYYNGKMDRRRSKSASIGMAIMAGCLLYVASSILDSSDGAGSSSVDYDHYVPGHRFLSSTDSSVYNTDIARRLMDSKNIDISGITLTPRSPEDAAAVRRRTVAAAKKRALSLGGEEGLLGESPMTKEVARDVFKTSNALEIPPQRQINVTEYDIDDALLANRAFHRELLFFVYDSATDDFVVVHNLPSCDWGCKRVYIIAPVLAYALRMNYPSRFQGHKSGDMVILLSTGDMPRVRRPCLFPDAKYCKSENWAPILQFGSVLADPVYMPTAIAMPQSPRPHIPCIDEFQTTGKVCQDLQPRVMNAASNAAAVGGTQDLKTGQHFQHGLVFGQELGLITGQNYWDNLIPQVVWRGTDFKFLHTLFPDMRAPTYEEDLKEVEGTFGNANTRGAIETLWAMGEDKLTPRWRGVLLTSEAELEALEQEEETGQPTLPWVNIKFASCNVDGQKVPASENQDFQLLQDQFGIAAIGNSMNMMEHARYKYHIDLGGGGGTTWTGTIEKLALPGVLLHHVTPTKDWFHDHLEPWVHYIPIATDLSDLKEKYDWAESNPAEAQRIAEAGTEFARWMGSLEGYGALYQEHIVAPLGKIITAYKSPRKKYHGQKALDILKEFSDGSFGTVARCGGWPAESTQCRWTKKGGDGELNSEPVAETFMDRRH